MSISEFDGPTGDLKGRATRGALFTGVAQAARIAIQLSSVVLLARLLSPSDFGVMGMVAPIYGFAMMFQDFGLTQATIQKSDINQAQLSALFWINFGVSVAIGGLLMLASPLVGLFYGDARVASVVVAFGAIMMVAGLGSQHMALLNRRMRFGVLSLIDTLGAAAGLAASVIAAIVLKSYWALVAGSLASALVPTISAWISVRWSPDRPKKADGMREILGFGAGITGFNFANFFARNLDNILIGRTWGDEALGLYDRAYKLLLFPLQQVTGPVGRVMLPVLARVRHEPERYRRAYLNVIAQMMLLVLPGVAWMISSSDLIVVTLLGDEWAAAGPIFGALGFAALIQPINSTTGWLYISQGRAKGYMNWGIAFTAASVASFVIGLPWGAIGVATAYAVAEYVKTPVIWWAVTRQGPIRMKDLFVQTSPHLAGAGAALAGIVLLRTQLQLGSWAELVVCLVAAYITAWSVVALTGPGRAAFKESLSLVESVIGKFLRRPARA